jgi:hypothetical protein
LQSLPFRAELAVGQHEVHQNVVDAGFGALGVALRGGDPFRHIEGAVSHEAELRVERLRQRYEDWWDASYPAISDATAKLQDRLFGAAIELGSAATGRQTAP